MKNAKEIIEKLKNAGYEAYLVGGCVRDLVLNRTPKDYDIATNATPVEIIEIGERNGWKIKEVGKSFGVVLVKFNDGMCYEVATYRTDGYSMNHRHPDYVIFSDNLIEDLERRDFTMNAMAFDPFTNELIDPFNGQDDIKNRIIRPVGNSAERFQEDYLRMLRLIRFSSELHFSPIAEALNEIKRDPSRILDISAERISGEINKILMSDRPSIAFKLMRDTGLLAEIFPEIDILKVVPQDIFHYDSVFDHTMKVLDNSVMLTDDIIVRLTVLLHDVGKGNTISYNNNITFKEHASEGAQIATKILKWLRYSNEIISSVETLVRYHMTLYFNSTRSLFRRYIRLFGFNNTNRLLLVHLSDKLDCGITPMDLMKINTLDDVNEELKNSGNETLKLAISGKDIMNCLKIPQGKIVGAIKNHLYYLIEEEMLPNERLSLIMYLETLSKVLKRI